MNLIMNPKKLGVRVRMTAPAVPLHLAPCTLHQPRVFLIHTATCATAAVQRLHAERQLHVLTCQHHARSTAACQELSALPLLEPCASHSYNQPPMALTLHDPQTAERQGGRQPQAMRTPEYAHCTDAHNTLTVKEQRGGPERVGSHPCQHLSDHYDGAICGH